MLSIYSGRHLEPADFRAETGESFPYRVLLGEALATVQRTRYHMFCRKLTSIPVLQIREAGC